MSSLFKKSIPVVLPYGNSSTAGGIPSLKTLNSISFKKLDRHNGMQSSSSSARKLMIFMDCTDPSDLPAKSPPEVPTAPPWYKPGTPPEFPRIFINEPQFDPTPPVKVPVPPSELPPPPQQQEVIPPRPSEPDIVLPVPPSTLPPPPGLPEVIPPRPRKPDVIPPVPTPRPDLPEPGEEIPPQDPTLDPTPNGPDFFPPPPPELRFPHPAVPDAPFPVM